jgi:hypothetical protein
VPERYLKKFENFFYDVLVRMNHALDRRGSYTFAWLKELGAALTDQTTIVFALGLVSGMYHNVAAISARSQDAGDLPWARWRALKRQRLASETEVVTLARSGGAD